MSTKIYEDALCGLLAWEPLNGLSNITNKLFNQLILLFLLQKTVLFLNVFKAVVVLIVGHCLPPGRPVF
jgi:hypothetical protein